MNPITEFLVRNIVAVFFVYGLAFFSLGLTLALAARRSLEVRFTHAIRLLAAFGFVHGVHEWFEMFQKLSGMTGDYAPTVAQEAVRLTILIASFFLLLLFGTWLLRSGDDWRQRGYIHCASMVLIWGLGALVVRSVYRPTALEMIALADVLSRYLLGIPGALVGAWALMRQQHIFRKRGMPQFGHDLVWGATALLLYGVIGQVFVQETALPPSTVINESSFLSWFGIPVQLFRTVMAVVFAFSMVRTLRAFGMEDRQRSERLNEELRMTARELALLLDLSNLLAAPMSLQDRLDTVLRRIVDSMSFPDAGTISLVQRATGTLRVWSSSGFSGPDGTSGGPSPQYALAADLGARCVAGARTVCRHLDGQTFEFAPHETLERQKCRNHPSPARMIALPLSARQEVIGTIVLGRTRFSGTQPIPLDEFQLMVGAVQQLGLSIENARLYQEAQEREKRLADLLHQAVGAQEAERQRIARELHDVTGQSLTAIALGLRGVETTLTRDLGLAVEQVRELKSFGTNALSELRHIIADLRPPQLDDLGLVAALKWYAQQFETRYGIATNFVLQGEQFRLPPEYGTVLFRIAQEALTNVARHAGAAQVTVRLAVRPGEVCIEVEDDGRGFNPQETLENEEPAGWGLLGIQERASLLGGQCRIDAAFGRGTRVEVTVPVVAEANHVQDTAVAG